jgi:hypothetical protein
MRALLEERRAREVLEELVQDAHRLVARSIMLAPPIDARRDHEVCNTGRDETVSLHVCAPRLTPADLGGISARVPIG